MTGLHMIALLLALGVLIYLLAALFHPEWFS